MQVTDKQAHLEFGSCVDIMFLLGYPSWINVLRLETACMPEILESNISDLSRYQET